MADGILNPIEQLEADFDFDVYTKQEVDALLDEKADKSDTYTKTETDALLDDKADADAVYTKTETDTLLSAKADKSTTLAGYGITDAYTKTETDNLLNGKADADDVYTKSEIDTKIPSSVGSATKPVYVNGGVVTECTYELKKTVPANAVFTDTTYTAGNGLNLSGTSFYAKAGTNVTVDGNGINVNGNGAVASADSGLVSGGTAYTELRPTLDGTWVKNAQTTAINLQKLEGGIEYLYAILSKQYDQLKKYINGNYYDYDTDANSKYTKSVPQGAMPYASLDSIGGKTLVWNQLCDHSASTSTGENGVTYTNNGDGSWTLSGTASADGSKNVNTHFPTHAGHKYYLRGCPVGGNQSTYCLKLNGVFLETSFETGSGKILTCTTNNAYGFVQIGVKSGTDVTGVTFKPQVTDLTLLCGAGNEPTTVQEFTAQFPAQYYPYNAGTLLSAGVTEVVSKGKNLFDKSTLDALFPNLITQTDDGFYATSSNALNIKSFWWNETESDVFTIKVSVKYDSASSNGLYIGYTYTDESYATLSFANAKNAYETKTITTSPSKRLRNLWFAYSSANIVSHFKDFQIEVGTTATDYSPYKEISTPIPAEVQALEGYGWSAGSVYNYVDFERKKFVKCVDRIVLDGTQTLTNNWRPTASGVGWYYQYSLTNHKLPASYNSVINLTSDKLEAKSYNAVFGGAYGITSNTSNAYGLFVYQSDTSLTTESAINTYLSANPITVYYEMDTPQEIDISAYLTDDNLIEVEAGGTLTFENQNGDDYRIDVPSAETYMVDLQSAL